MLAYVADGPFDGVLVYNLDRLTRRPFALEALADAMTAAGVRRVNFVTGDLDKGEDDGLMVARAVAPSRPRSQRQTGAARSGRGRRSRAPSRRDGWDGSRPHPHS